MKIIDVHTHIYDEKIFQDYAMKSKKKISKKLVLHSYSIEFDGLIEFINSKQNLFLVGSVDINQDIGFQLKILEKLFKEKRLYGIKMHPGYQYFCPSDKFVWSIAELCQKYDKPLVFHSGDVYDPQNKSLLKYSHPKYIDELAVKFSNCKIIISHFGFPYFIETANIVSKNENVYTDISGTLDKADSKDEEENMFGQYVADLIRVFNYFPDIKKKTMFGTDYSGENTPLNLIEPYIKLVKNVFSKKEQEDVFYKTAEKVFGLK